MRNERVVIDTNILLRCELVEIHRSIQDIAVDLRLRHRLKLPDAVIAATAVHLGIPLITADKVFSKLKPEAEVVLYAK
ncbi:MAG: PIN domain-containing protein [Flavobacteriales bacterium]|nr:PIN domain-containing protein [Flavobacteriales bacterium]